MSYGRLNRLVGEKAGAYIECIAEDDSMKIAKDISRCLNDEHFVCQQMSDGLVIGLYNVASALYEQVQMLMLRNIDICKIAMKTKMQLYKIEAMNGLRFATVNEVNNGVAGLIPFSSYPAGEDVSKQLFILAWVVTGNTWYYRQAGFKNHFSESGKVTDTVVDMLNESAETIVGLIRLMNNETKLNKVLKILKKSKFEYTTYATDEVTEEVSVKQLLLDCEQLFKGTSTNASCRRAKSLLLKSKKDKLTPSEISELRKIKAEVLEKGIEVNSDTVEEQVKNKCEYLLNLKYTGRISGDAFVFKIISTLERCKYVRCSDKQLAIIEEALKSVGYYDVEENNVVSESDIDSTIGKDIEDDSMLSIGELPW